MIRQRAPLQPSEAARIDALGARDKNELLGILETPHFLVQRHNYKEEGIIYPMADGALPD